MEEVDRTLNHMQDDAANFPDPADRATQEEEFSIELRIVESANSLRKSIRPSTYSRPTISAIVKPAVSRLAQRLGEAYSNAVRGLQGLG